MRRRARVAALVTACACLWAPACDRGAGRVIRVGVLHSFTGAMAPSERPVADATRLAVEELNAAGGVRVGSGLRRVEIVEADGESDPGTFARQARHLLQDEKVSVVFGCWTSACRKTVEPVFEENDGLLFYPLQYEGLEQSPYVVYMGATPNQQLVPAVQWARRKGFRRVFLVGSDYVFPRAANAIMRGELEHLRAEIVGEDYVLLGSTDVEDVVRDIARARPDIVLNTINGMATNMALFRELGRVIGTADDLPVLSFSLSEIDLAGNAELMAGHYVAWSYFESVDTRSNRDFVRRFQRRFGAGRVVADPMVSAYVGVYMWAGAVEAAGTADPAIVREHVGGRSFRAPDTMVYIDAETHHIWKPMRIGRIRDDGQIEIEWTSGIPIRPEPFPPLRSRADWEAFLLQLRQQWGGAWENPGP